MKKYYPSGYRRKRQRENTQRLVGYLIVAVVIGGMAVVAAWAVIRMLMPGTPEEGAVKLAEIHEELESQAIEEEADLNPPPEISIDEAAVPDVEDTSEFQSGDEPIELDDIEEFEESFPEIGVTLVASGDEVVTTDEADTGDETDEETTESPEVEGSLVPDADDSGSEATPEGGSSVRPGPPVAREPEPPADSTADNQTDDSLDRDSGQESSSDSTDEQADEDSSSSATEGSSGATGDYLYSVYAGSWHNKDVASRKRDELSGIGYASRITERNEGGQSVFYVIVLDSTDSYHKAVEVEKDLESKGFGEAFVWKKNA